MAKITTHTLQNYLNARSKEELIEELIDLFGRLDEVKEYYQAKLIPMPEDRTLRKYKAAIRKEFFPAKGFPSARWEVARKMILEYKKISADPVKEADLMLFYVEVGVEFSNLYVNLDEAFYNSMESMYDKALQFLRQHHLHDDFQLRCQGIVADAKKAGMGFNEVLAATYKKYFGLIS